MTPSKNARVGISKKFENENKRKIGFVTVLLQNSACLSSRKVFEIFDSAYIVKNYYELYILSEVFKTILKIIKDFLPTT